MVVESIRAAEKERKSKWYGGGGGPYSDSGSEDNVLSEAANLYLKINAHIWRIRVPTY